MGEQGGDPSGQAPEGVGPSARDGSIDFSRYSLEQLNELRDSLDRQTFPRNFANLLAELEHRAQEPPAAATLQPVRFTPLDGLRGWWQACSQRQPLYGAGSLELKPREIVLQGWQRTWLGVPQQTVLVIPTDELRSVVCHRDRLMLAWKPPGRRARRVQLTMGSSGAAQALMAQLPETHRSGFVERWGALQDFQRRLAIVSPKARVTPLLILVNFAVYCATAVVAGRLGLFDLQQLVDWGGNFGPYTLNGEPWRLLSSTFLHANLLHVLLNMWALWNIGRLTERLYGTWPYLLLYFSTGLVASATSVAWNPVPVSVGASGPIFGLLGAFLMFFLRRRSELPASLWRSHWISTLAFALVNIVNGAFNPQIDNAAHVGGLVSGMSLGWLLARSLDPELRSEFPFKESVGVLMLTGTATGLLLLQVTGLGSGLSPPEQFFRAHAWYQPEAARNVNRWNQLAVQEAQGVLSDAEVGRRFDAQIKPFWQATDERLEKERSSLPAAQQPLAKLLSDYTHLRLKWVSAVIAATQGDASQMQVIQTVSAQANLIDARIQRITMRATMDYRARSLAQNRWTLSIRDALTTHQRHCTRRTPVAATEARSDGPAAREAASCLALRLFLSDEYAALDALINQEAGKLEDLPDGSSTLSGLFEGLDVIANGSMSVEDALTHTAGWRRALPGSLLPDLVDALTFRSWAWSARGHAYASEVSRQAWAVFEYRLEMAAAALEDTKPLARLDPYWYELSLQVGLDQSDTPPRLRALFDEAIKRFPGYLPIYSNMLCILMPRWGGSYEQIDQLIREVSRVSGTSGDVPLYAHLYWLYASLEQDETDIFTEAHAQWPLMKQGFVRLLELHPRSDLVLNAFAKFACMAGDADQYRQLRPLLKDRASQAAWSQKIRLQSCDAKLPPAP
jgi:rhomboid protease GluP